MKSASELKIQVRDFWEEKSCGEVYATGQSEREYYESHAKARYELEPYILDFAKFHEGRGKDILEIGVGMGADYVEWAKSAPRSLTGIDLTPRAIEHTKRRLAVYGLESAIKVGDAEELPFETNSFDLVYSWGVLHHSPNTDQAIQEVFRVLRPGGTARILIYHRRSLTGYMLWVRYGLMTGRFFRSLSDVYFNHLESPGTKAFSIDEAKDMFRSFSIVNIRTQLSFGDLLEGSAGQRHGAVVLAVARALWPRALLRSLFKNHGLMMLIEARK